MNVPPRLALRSTPTIHFGTLRTFVRPYRGWLIIAFFCVIFGASLGLVFPWLTGNLIDYITEDAAGNSSLNRTALLLIVVFAAQAVFAYIRILSLARAGQGVVRDIRTTLFDRLLKLPVSFFDRHHSGDISSRLMSDASVIHGSSSGAGPEAAFSAITVVGGTILLFATSTHLALVVVALTPIMIIVAWIYGRQIRKVSRAYQDQVAVTNALATEAISGVRVIKWFTAEDDVTERYRDATQRVVQLGSERAAVRGRWTALMTFAASASLAGVVWMGGLMVQDGTLSIGGLVSFLLYALLVSRGLASLVERYSQLQNSLGSIERVFDLLGETSELDAYATPGNVDLRNRTSPDTAAHDEPATARGAVHFDHVWFSYEGREQQVLSDVTLTINPGEMVALIGPSGSGKSTIAQLLTRFYDPDQGRILVDNRDIRSIPPQRLRSTIAVVPQDAPLFSGTIEENIKLGSPSADDSAFIAACSAANVGAFVVDFPDGYGTRIGEGGIALSGGQRQRIAIARAFIADPNILILDEATSSLDTEAEFLVQDALARLMADRTNLVIAHRLSTVRSADRIVVLSGGRVIEIGTHEDLAPTNGFYSRMVEQQLAL